MRGLHGLYLLAGVMFFAGTLQAGYIYRKLNIGLDPLGPAAALYEEKVRNISASNWGARVDFNLGGFMSTGPEIWSGTYALRGEEADELIRREDFWPSERHRLSGSRLRWNFTFWEVSETMRGWFLNAGIAYTSISSKANRITEHSDAGDAFPGGRNYREPDDETDLITDIRHGVSLGFGQRWIFYQRLSATLGLSWHHWLRREVNVDSDDPRAKKDYEVLIEELPLTRFSARPYPDTSLTLGYAF